MSHFAGLRATEKDLAKLKCLKCDYQAYYAQQLQQHLKDSHADDLSDLVRCKCCTFLCFDDETLRAHMKVCAGHDHDDVLNIHTFLVVDFVFALKAVDHNQNISQQLAHNTGTSVSFDEHE